MEQIKYIKEKELAALQTKNTPIVANMGDQEECSEFSAEQIQQEPVITDGVQKVLQNLKNYFMYEKYENENYCEEMAADILVIKNKL